MKKIITLLLSFSFIGLLSAQTIEENEFNKEKEMKTVMNSIQIHRISGFGGPTMSYSSINKDFAFLMGGGGGIIVNNLFIGGYGEGLSSSLDVSNEHPIRDLDFGHGGFWVGYEIFHKSLIHPVISSKIGWGSISGYGTEYTLSHYFRDNVFVVVPSISAEINFTRFFKINVGAEYRRTINVNNTPNMDDNDFSSLGVNMNFIFGWF